MSSPTKGEGGGQIATPSGKKYPTYHDHPCAEKAKLSLACLEINTKKECQEFIESYKSCLKEQRELGKAKRAESRRGGRS